MEARYNADDKLAICRIHIYLTNHFCFLKVVVDSCKYSVDFSDVCFSVSLLRGVMSNVLERGQII